eukprot:SAG31_NODE_326_length_17664_cov_10.038543_11_plen_360_part_00
MAALAEKMGYELSEMELKEAMYAMDADGSGEVDFDEFAEWWIECGEEKSKWMELLNERDNRREKDLRAAFNSIDTDGGGTIDHDEFTELCTSLDPSMTAADIDDAIADIDADGDGEISFEEFQEWWFKITGQNADSDDSDDEGSGGGTTTLQQRLIALVMLKSQKPTQLAEIEEMPDLSDPAVRKAGMMLVAAAARFQMRRKAAAYRKEQLENLKSTPDWLARSVGWKDAHEMVTRQYELDYADSLNGTPAAVVFASFLQSIHLCLFMATHADQELDMVWIGGRQGMDCLPHLALSSRLLAVSTARKTLCLLASMLSTCLLTIWRDILFVTCINQSATLQCMLRLLLLASKALCHIKNG